MVCPNKNDKNWKILESAFGPVGAMAVFEKMGLLDINPASNSQKDVIEALQKAQYGDDLVYETTELNRAQEIIANKRLRLARLNVQITQAKKNNEFGRMAELQGDKIALTQSLDEIIEDQQFETIILHGNADMQYLEKLREKDNITDAELDAARKITGTWMQAVDFMTSDEKKDLDLIRNDLAGIASHAKMLREDFDKVASDNLERFVKSVMGSDFISKIQKDINFGGKFLDISRIQDTRILAMFKSIKKANMNARDEAGAIMNTLEKLTEKLSSKPGGMKAVYDMLAQEYENGSRTGAMITRISADYSQKKFGKWRSYLEYAGKDKNRAAALLQDYRDFLNENEVTMDVRKLFEGAPGRAEHVAQLTEAMGEVEFNKQLAKLEKKWEAYKISEESMSNWLISEYGEGETADTNLRKFIIENSPAEWSNYLADTKNPKYKTIKPKGRDNTYSIPIVPEAYDKRFAAIEADEDVKAYYDFVSKTMKSLHQVLPEDQQNKLKDNALPFIKNSLAETYNKQGFRTAAESIYSAFQKSNRASTPGTTMYEYQDPETGQFEDYLRAPDMDDRDKINEVYRTKKMEAKSKGIDVTAEMDNTLYREAQAEVASQKSFDFNKIVSSMALLAKSYEHRSNIEDQVRLINNHIQTMEETMQKNGVIQKDKDGNVLKKAKTDSFKKLRDVVGNHMDVAFFEKKRDDEGVFGDKKYTKEEQTEKDRLQAMLDSGKLTEGEAKQTQELIDKLGGKLATSSILGNVMKWVQLKGMGYNPLGGFANMMFGVISNLTHAAGGEDFDLKQYMTAQMMAMQTIGKATPTGRKIDALMKKWDVLKDATNEINEGGNIKKARKMLDPYWITQKTEYLNQAPVMIAMLQKQGVWDKFDEEGNFTGEGTFDSEDFRIRLDQVVKSMHGNYDPDSPIEVKKTIAGRMSSQFRTWIFESANSRFGGEVYDELLGRERKGRYRSVMPSLKSILKHKDFKHMSDVDKANMKKNLMEAALLLTVMGTTLALAMMAGDDDDEKMAYYNLAINMINRAQDDILFYVNPASLDNITKQIIPASSIIKDTYELIGATGQLILGDDIIESGSYAGDSRWTREMMQFAPVLSKVQGAYSAATQIYK